MAYLKEILRLNLKDFGGANFPVGIVLFFTFIGLMIAVIVVQHANRVLYRAVKALHRHKATSEDTAKTLEALGLGDNRALIRAAEAKSPLLMRYLCAAKEDAAKAADGEQDAKNNEKAEAKSTRYYLKPAMEDRAAEILSGGEPTALHSVLYCALFVIIYLFVASILPLALSIIL